MVRKIKLLYKVLRTIWLGKPANIKLVKDRYDDVRRDLNINATWGRTTKMKDSLLDKEEKNNNERRKKVNTRQNKRTNSANTLQLVQTMKDITTLH